MLSFMPEKIERVKHMIATGHLQDFHGNNFSSYFAALKWIVRFHTSLPCAGGLAYELSVYSESVTFKTGEKEMCSIGRG